MSLFDLDAVRDSNRFPALGLKLPICEQSITLAACSKSFSPNRSIDSSTACATRRPDVIWFCGFARGASGSLVTSSRSPRGSTRCASSLGPGWRMYYARRGDILIVMLGGGTKGTQARDIEKAIALAETIEES